MNGSLIQKCLMDEEGSLVVKSFQLIKIVTVKSKKFWQIPVPAAAAIQEEQAVFIVVACKGYVNGFFLNIIKN
jgi:hypothetical protein